MGKIFAVVLGNCHAGFRAYPIIVNKYAMPEDISTHGHMIDDQLHETMWEAGLSFCWRHATGSRFFHLVFLPTAKSAAP